MDTSRGIPQNSPYQIMRCRSSFLVVFLSLVAVLFGAGCAWVPQTARIQVSPKVAPSTEGRGVKFAVEVLDRRLTTKLGHRGVDSENAAITSEQNIAVLVRDALVAGYVKKGFNVVIHEGDPGRVLTVELSKLEYTTDMVYWKGIVMTDAVLNATTFKSGVRFQQIYTGRRKETTIEAPRAKTNERLLNEAITEATKNLLEDPNLLRFLAE